MILLLLLLLSLFLECFRVVCLFGITKSWFLFHKYSINQTHCRRGIYFSFCSSCFFFFLKKKKKNQRKNQGRKWSDKSVPHFPLLNLLSPRTSAIMFVLAATQEKRHHYFICHLRNSKFILFQNWNSRSIERILRCYSMSSIFCYIPEYGQSNAP